MADSVELRMSVTSIKIVDPYVKDILATSTHVALYKFNNLIGEWEKTETEGALFVYSRTGEPFHSLMIVNRLSQNNLIEPIVKDFEYQMQAPFLLYRNSKNKIFGIWFYNKEECVTITYILESLMEGLKDKMNDKNKKAPTVDIFSMLSKAQEDYNKTPTKSEAQPQFQSTPRAPDVTSQSVMDFFAKAISKSNKPPQTNNVIEGETLIQKLMNNPEHSVEHIEKQQRSVTPQDAVAVRPKLNNNNADRRSVPISFNNSTNISVDKKGDNGFNFINFGSPQQPSSMQPSVSPLTNFLGQTPSNIDEREVGGASPLAQLLETPHKPTLLPPMMFTTTGSAVKEKNDITPMLAQNISSVNPIKTIEPLTKNQMLQAMTYLLKNDPDFVNKLHEAYVKSLSEMVQSNCSNPLI